MKLMIIAAAALSIPMASASADEETTNELTSTIGVAVQHYATAHSKAALCGLASAALMKMDLLNALAGSTRFRYSSAEDRLAPGVFW
jgi:hypothetical protein